MLKAWRKFGGISIAMSCAIVGEIQNSISFEISGVVLSKTFLHITEDICIGNLKKISFETFRFLYTKLMAFFLKELTLISSGNSWWPSWYFFYFAKFIFRKFEGGNCLKVIHKEQLFNFFNGISQGYCQLFVIAKNIEEVIINLRAV